MVSYNGLGIAEGGEIVAQMLSSAPQLAKPFLFANLHFSKQIKNGFCGIEVQKLNLALNPLFCQYDVPVAQLKYTKKTCVKTGYFVN